MEQKTNFFESRVSDYALTDKSQKEDAFSSDGFDVKILRLKLKDNKFYNNIRYNKLL